MAAFEAATKEAHRYKLWLPEAFALCDLKRCVLDELGHGEHGSRRIGAVLRLLKGPAELLTPMLKGLDAAELMALPPPEAGYEVVYAVDDATTAELRQNLGSLRLKALRQKARAEGIDEGILEESIDAQDPKEAVITLLVQKQSESLQQAKAQESEAKALRHELEGLGLKELRRRAREVGVAEEILEDAIDANEPKVVMVAVLLENAAAGSGMVPEGVPPAPQRV